MDTEWRIELLKAFHRVIINMGDEICYETWVTLGVPDCPQEDDFEWIADNDSLFQETCKLFCNLVEDFM